MAPRPNPPIWAKDAKDATDTARAKIRKVLLQAKGLDSVDRDNLQSAILALDWVRSHLGELAADAAELAGTR